MSDPTIPESQPTPEAEESFGQALSQYEQSRSRKRDDASKQLQGTVIAVSAESVFVDIGYKTEGILPRALFESSGATVNPGDQFPVSITGRDPEGYYQLSRSRVSRRVDWPS